MPGSNLQRHTPQISDLGISVNECLPQAREDLEHARRVLQGCLREPGYDPAIINPLLAQCDLLDMGWAHIEQYCAGLNGNAERAAKMEDVFSCLGVLARGTIDAADGGSDLVNAVRQLKWRRRAEISPSEAPSSDALAAALAEATGEPVEILERKRNAYSSTFPSEVILLRRPGGAICRLLAKYENGRFRDVGGHRGGPTYEAGIYRDVLAPLELSRPRFLGALDPAPDGGVCLFLEYIENALRPDDADDPALPLRAAARWAGLFHLTAQPAPCLHRYDAGYYRNWAHRAGEYSAMWRTRYPWLQPLCVRAEGLVASLGSVPASVIHGEFTPHNLLVRGNDVYPVDWESTAMGVAEIDLASLTDGWSPDIAEACEREYVAARFGGTAPAGFVERLELARLYWTLRWLGNTHGVFPTMRMMHRIESLEPLARRVGVIAS